MGTNIRKNVGSFMGSRCSMGRLAPWGLLLLLLPFLLLPGGCGSSGGGGGAPPKKKTGTTGGIVADHYFYVSAAAADDTGSGLKGSAPKQLIASAIALAAAEGGAVLVAEGTYSVTSGTDHIILVEGVSLYGGFSANFTARDSSIHTTTITDVSTATTGDLNNPNRAVEAGSAITTATVLDGFTIIGGEGDYSAAIYIDVGSPTIRNNTITGSTTTNRSYGIFNDGGAAGIISGNTIDGGDGAIFSYGILNLNLSEPDILNNTLIAGGGGGNQSFGIRNDSGSTPAISNNTLIDGGTGTNASSGIYNDVSSPDVSGNTIVGGSGGSQSFGIQNRNGSAPDILNNDIDGGEAGASSWGIYNDSSAPLISGNTIYGGDGSGGATGTYGIEEFASSSTIRNNAIDGGVTSNISIGVRVNSLSAGTIRNNTISSGIAPTNAWGIYLGGTPGNASTPTIENNIVVGGLYCILENSAESDPVSVRNNDLTGCTTLYYDDDTSGSLTAIADVNDETQTTQGAAGTAGGNVSESPQFVSGSDPHLTASSPAALTEGGLNFSVTFTTDKDGATRIGGAQGNPGNENAAGWSMGAYEYDVVATPRNLMFVTSTTQNGALGGLTGADALCEARAAAAGLQPNTYVAWLSTSTVNAKDRLGVARGWVRPDGRPFADTVTALTAGTVYYPPRLDEFGVDVGKDVDVFTGTNPDGTKYSDTDTCSDWTTSGGTGLSGYADAGTRMWTTFFLPACTSNPIYCFGTDHANAATPAAPPAGRVAFISDATWTPGGGTAGADARCQADATAASLANPGTFKALLATTGFSAASRFNLAGIPWVRPDNVLIVLDAADLPTDLLFAPLNLTADGVTYRDTNWGWVGADDLATAGVSTCTDWSVTSGSAVDTDVSRSKISSRSLTQACSSTQVDLLCLED